MTKSPSNSLLESRVIYGSPRTVTHQLDAFREQVGPFGTLVVSAMDWSGPNQAWEKESFHLLTQEVMPAWRNRLRQRAAT